MAPGRGRGKAADGGGGGERRGEGRGGGRGARAALGRPPAIGRGTQTSPAPSPPLHASPARSAPGTALTGNSPPAGRAAALARRRGDPQAAVAPAPFGRARPLAWKAGRGRAPSPPPTTAPNQSRPRCSSASGSAGPRVSLKRPLGPELEAEEARRRRGPRIRGQRAVWRPLLLRGGGEWRKSAEPGFTRAPGQILTSLDAGVRNSLFNPLGVRVGG